MTIAVCLNFGDRIYLATDSLMSIQLPDGTYKALKNNYRLKLYHLPNVNGMVAFAGRMDPARQAIGRLIDYASRTENVTEQSLFQELPSLIAPDFESSPRASDWNFQLLFAALAPGSQAYEQEKFPGLGVPPKTFCGVFSVDFERRKVQKLLGRAIHIPSNPAFRFFTAEPQFRLMDGFIVGSGARRIGRESEFFFLKHQRLQFVMSILAPMLHAYFDRVPIHLTGVGGAFQIGMISEKGTEGRISVVDSRLEEEPQRLATVHQVDDPTHISFLVHYEDTGEVQVIRSVFDDRLPYEISEIDLFG